MSHLGVALASWLHTSAITLLPIPILIYTPYSWWGIGLKIIAGIWALMMAMTMLTRHPPWYNGSGPGFMLNMAFLTLALLKLHTIATVICLALVAVNSIIVIGLMYTWRKDLFKAAAQQVDAPEPATEADSA